MQNMKRIIIFLSALALALCMSLTALAGGPAGGYVIPEGLKTFPASLESLALPAELPEAVRITSFSAADGMVKIELDREVPQLKIYELNFMDGTENTIFSGKNLSSAEAHMAGKDNTIFTIEMVWELDNFIYRREYNTWSGELAFSGCTATEVADPAEYAPYTSVYRVLTFSEDAVLTSETWSLENDQDHFARIISYDAEGKASSSRVSWRSVDLTSYVLDATLDADGVLTALECRDGKTAFIAQSQKPDDDMNAVDGIRTGCYDPDAFDTELMKNYPAMREKAFGPSTATDLAPSTMTDLAAAIPENARVWALSFGDYLDAQVYAFVTESPVFVLQDGKASLNPDALDINGTPIAVSKKLATQTPAFEIPAAE